MKKNLRSFKLFTDGACSGNPGPAGIGVVIKQKGEVISTISKGIGHSTNNFAEYMAMVYGLQQALILKAEKIEACTDSELLFKQFFGYYKIKDTNIKLLFDQIQHLVTGFKTFQLRHIPREQNKEADVLAKKSLKPEQAKMVASRDLFGEESPSSEG